MKKIAAFVLSLLMLPAAFASAATVEDWSGVASANTGTYADSNGSKIEFATAADSKGGKALQLTSNLVQGGYCGIWHNISADLSKSGALKFMAKSTVAGEIQMALKDAYNVQYVASFQVGTSWAEANIPLASFIKDPYYTPPEAVTGHPMDLSKTSGMNLAPHMVGPAVILIGSIETVGSAGAASSSQASSASASSSASSGSAVQVLDPSTIDAKSAGSFQDSQGSSFSFASKDNPSKKGKKYLTLTYELKNGGYCGMWCRAGGADWSGANLASAKTLNITLYSKEPVVLGIALKDKGNNQYVAEAPSTKGGKWETVSIPMDSFKLDPYYTPPDAVKGAPKDFSKVGTFNIQPKTPGKFTVAVESVVAK